MDVSQEYIDMCRKAYEIQELWIPNDDKQDVVWNGDCIDHWYILGNKESYVWLPRQDQLQEFIIRGDTLSKLQGVWIFVNSFKLEPASMEQLWLMSIMWQKYSKKWNGTTWEEKNHEETIQSQN